MQEIRYFCDICKKEIAKDAIYYSAGVHTHFGYVTAPIPNTVECCSPECISKWTELLNVNSSLYLPKVTVVPEKMAHLEKGAQLGKPKEPKKEKPK